MNIQEMTMEQIETRTSEIQEELKKKDANLDELEKEIDELETRRAEIQKQAEERKAQIDNIMSKSTTVETFEKEETRKTMEIKELRSRNEYIDAYVEYMKTGDDKQVRKLITDLAPESSIAEGDGVIPTPVYLEERILTAWERDDIARRVPRTYVAGTYKIGFEASATDAVIHVEGSPAPAQEQLQVGVVELKPETIKKWIKVSDEVLDLKGVAFLDYLYDEIQYKIAHKSVEVLIDDIVNSPAASTATQAGVPTITAGVTGDTILNAFVNLSDEATNPVVIMNKQTYANFKSLRTTAGARLEDVFEGLEVLFNNHLPAYNAAQADQVYLIVGDLNGSRFNFPKGEEVTFKYDDLTEAELDLVKIVGRMSVGHGVVAPNFFVTVKKA